MALNQKTDLTVETAFWRKFGRDLFTCIGVNGPPNHQGCRAYIEKEQFSLEKQLGSTLEPVKRVSENRYIP